MVFFFLKTSLNIIHCIVVLTVNPLEGCLVLYIQFVLLDLPLVITLSRSENYITSGIKRLVVHSNKIYISIINMCILLTCAWYIFQLGFLLSVLAFRLLFYKNGSGLRAITHLIFKQYVLSTLYWWTLCNMLPLLNAFMGGKTVVNFTNSVIQILRKNQF